MKIDEVWLEFQRKLFLFIRSRVETSEDAEDILNDVFARLIGKVNDGNVPDNISSWLYHVTKNRIVDYYRAKKTFDKLPDDLAQKSADMSAVKQLAKCMLPMIQALPEMYQQPLILSEIEGKQYKEVAAELDLTVSAIKSRILRGREKLHKSLVSCCTIYRNNAENVVDYEQKMTGFCSNYDD
jgi:RNA polymerase sigma-70 factor (ECF subfamily)